MLSLVNNIITTFFNNLASLLLTPTEIIKLSNVEIIPILTYCLIYNSPPPRTSTHLTLKYGITMQTRQTPPLYPKQNKNTLRGTP